MTTEQFDKTENTGWIKGLAYAIALLKRDFAKDEIAEIIFNESGITLQDCIENGVDDYDLDAIKELAGKELIEDTHQRPPNPKGERIADKLNQTGGNTKNGNN